MKDMVTAAIGRARIARTLLLNLAAIGILMAMALLVLLDNVIERIFAELEDREIAAHVARMEDFKKSNLVAIEARSKDWAIWDDTYRYAQDFNPAYEASNANADSFTNAMIDGLAVVRYGTGEVRSHAFNRETGEADPELAVQLEQVVSAPAFAMRVAARDAYQAFVPLGGRIYSLGAANILRSDRSGTSPGYLVFVLNVDDEQATEALQAPARIVLGETSRGTSIVKNDDHVTITTSLENGANQAIGQLVLTVERPLPAAASRLLGLASAVALLVILAMLGVLHWRVRQLVLRPMERLNAHLHSIRETGELSLLEAHHRDDEFGKVQNEFNMMTVELQELRAQLESQSFALGKSQSAIGLMHNLRNCLSPVRVILDLLEQEVDKPLPPHLPRALEELATPDADPARRLKLVEFLAAAHEQIGAQGASNRRAVREAARNLMNGLAAIDTAQRDTGDVSFEERCDVASMLSHAGNIVRFAEGLDVETEIDADQGAIVAGNRVLLSQVLENLVMNAIESLRAGAGAGGAIRFAAKVDEAGGTCRITVSDDGLGFDQEVAPRLFERGFSTRASKSGGLGLHWCANTVKAMNGSLTLESEGMGKGAHAQLTLPLWREQILDGAIAA